MLRIGAFFLQKFTLKLIFDISRPETEKIIVVENRQ